MSPDENGWHPAESQLADYAYGRSAFAPAASVETHVSACARCRSRLAEVRTELPIERMWQQILAVTGPAPPTQRHQRTRRPQAWPWTTFFTAPISDRRRIAFAVLTLVLFAVAMYPAYPRANDKSVSALTSEVGSADATAGPVSVPRNLQSGDGTIRPPRKGAVNPNIPDVPRVAPHASEGQPSSGPETRPTKTTPREPREHLALRSGSHPY